MTATELDDAIYPLTAMNSQRINIAHCLDKLMDESIIHVITEEDNGRTLYYDLNSEHDESSISDESVDEVTGYNKKLDVKSYMLHMLMNHSPEWIREDKLFDTVKENFTGIEDETIKNIIESLVNDNSVESDVQTHGISGSIQKYRFYRYKKRELEGDDMVEKERDKTEEEPDISEVYNEEKHMEHVKAIHSRMEIKEIYLCAVYSDMPSSVRIDDGYFDEKEGVKYFIESMHDDGIVCLEPEIILSMMVFNHDTDKSSFLAQRFSNLDDLEAWIEPFETALPIETSPQDDASDEASSE